MGVVVGVVEVVVVVLLCGSRCSSIVAVELSLAHINTISIIVSPKLFLCLELHTIDEQLITTNNEINSPFFLPLFLIFFYHMYIYIYVHIGSTYCKSTVYPNSFTSSE